MKDISHNSEKTELDPDKADENIPEVTKPGPNKEVIIKNENSVKNTSEKATRMADTDGIVNYIYNMYTESCENAKDDTNKVVNDEQGIISGEEISDDPIAEEPADNIDETPITPASAVSVLKYKYTDDQWSSLNQTGKKCYDLELLKQIKNDPLSKNKPDAPLLETCDVIRTAPMQEPVSFSLILRPVDDIMFPTFLKGTQGGLRSDNARESKKNGKGSVTFGTGGSNNSHKPVIHVSLSTREEVKLNQVDSAWKPTRLVQENLPEEEIKTQELYKKFRGILNKLTPQKFETLLKKVLELEIDNQKRMEGVIDLLFEKAIEEPNFSEVYANMCLKLASLRVPSDINVDNVVNFRGLIITKCQNQFEAGKSDELLMKLEKELAEAADPAKKKELQTMLNEENRKIRLRAVANVRFIGELYKLKMLTFKIMNYCMRHLIEPLEEENLECLCKLLTTIGEQVENEGGAQLDSIFKTMQDIVKRKSSLISSRVKFMIQDVIDLRRRKWLVKSVVDYQPKMMDQIQKEAEQQQRHIEIMNASRGGNGAFRRDDGGGSGAFRRDDGGRNKRGGDSPRLTLKGSTPRPTRPASTNYKVDQFKIQSGSTQKILTNIKLAPPKWTTPKLQQPPAPTNISISTNMYSVLENVDAVPTSHKAVRDATPLPVEPQSPNKASIERSPSNSRVDLAGSENVRPSPCAEDSTPEEPLPYELSKKVKSIVNLSLINPDDEQFRQEILQFEAKYHADVIALILNLLVEKTGADVKTLTKSLLHLVTTNTISLESFEAGLKETLSMAPDLYIDIPKLYDNIGIILAPHIAKKHITLATTLDLCGTVISASQGHILLKAIIHNLMESKEPTLVKNICQESGLQLNQWMDEEQVPKWIADNKFEFLEDQGTAHYQANEDSTNITPAETQARLLEFMNLDQDCDYIKGWVQEKVGKARNEDWFMRALIQAICEHALDASESVPYLNQDRMSKYVGLILEFGDSKKSREANCLEGIRMLTERLEHSQGLTSKILQYLQEQSIIPLDSRAGGV